MKLNLSNEHASIECKEEKCSWYTHGPMKDGDKDWVARQIKFHQNQKPTHLDYYVQYRLRATLSVDSSPS